MQIEHSEFQDQLVRGLAHKMNNILSLFHGYLGLLLDDKKLDPSTLSGLNRIKESASAASELIDRMNSLARPTSLVWREINVGDFLRSLRPAIEPHLKLETTLEVTCAEDVEDIWADSSRLKMALLEIARNAWEASPAHSRITIEAAAESPHTAGISSAAQPIHWISITVTDQGTGIPQHNLERIFHPFYTTKQKQNAAGLGLTVALGLVQQMGGVIRLTSRPGKTTVRLLLPSRSETI